MASLIANLTNFADQVTQLQLGDGSIATMELIFQGATERWVMNLSYGDTTINGLGVCCYPNLLRQWINILPFGLACVTPDQADPININDFASGRAQIYLLTPADVAIIETTTFGKVAA